MCFACQYSGDPAYDGENMGNEVKKSLRWRCALSGRRDALPTAMASLDADQLGRMDELRGCPAKETQMDRKYSEAEYFRTLLYSQGDRIAASLKTFFGVPNPEDLTSITLCGEDIRWNELTDDDSESSASVVSAELDHVRAVRTLGAKCAPLLDKSNAINIVNRVKAGRSITTCRRNVENMPDLRCDETTERCVYENPTTGKCSLDGPPSDSMYCNFPRGKDDQFNRKCDPSVKSRPEDCGAAQP